MASPISPDDASLIHATTLPDEVIEVFNDLIVEAMGGGRCAKVLQTVAADRVATRMGIPRQQVFDRHLLDVEAYYRDAGWKVEYDKPGYCETYEANFTFSKP